MSSTDTTNSRSNIHKELPLPETRNNLFDTIFDGDDTDDEWWEEEDTPPPNRNKAVAPIRITEWPKPPGTTTFSAQAGKRASIRQPVKRYSVQKPIRDKSTKRQKRQNAKAGIKLITNMTRNQPAASTHSQPKRPLPQTGCFVDLAALKALNGDSSQSNGFWKSKKGKESMVDPSIGSSKSTVRPTDKRNQGPENMLMPSPSKSIDDLSPNDRPIVIGLSIPSESVNGHSLSPETAASETTRFIRSYEHRTPTTSSPETPTIIITPAQAVSLWSALDESRSPLDPEYRSPSSVYSQAAPKHETTWSDQGAPPMPSLPASLLEQERQRIAGLKSCFSPDSDDATTWDDEEPGTARSRIVSSCTVFEEDESPILERNGRVRSMSAASQQARHLSMSSIRTRRLSMGWWNYITTPFLTRSNTFANRDAERPEVPALPSLAVAAAAVKARESEVDNKIWEKQFSPLTPETTTTIHSHQWYNEDLKLPASTEKSPVLQETRHKAQSSAGTLPIVQSEVAGLESASSESLSIGAQPQLSHDGNITEFYTPSTSGFSAGDREMPMLIDAPRPMANVSDNPYVQPRPSDLNIQSASRQVIQPVRATAIQATSTTQPSPGDAPPPPYSPPPARTRQYRPVFPPGHALGIQYPASPGPVSPGLQAAMSSGGAIPLSTIPLTPPARRPINLNSGYSTLSPRGPQSHVTLEYLPPPSQKISKAEAKRQRHEKEDAVARRAGGWWRGRGCIPDRGCYGRSGAEGRKRRRWYLGLIVGFLSVVILAVVLATQLHRSSNTMDQPSQWLNLTGFPPIFTGLSTIAAPINVNTNTGCVFPSTQWSCDLPKELQPSVAPNPSNQPNFILRIQWDNSTESNATFANVTGGSRLASRTLVGNAVSARQFIKYMVLKARQVVTFVPTPDPPTLAEDFFLGNTTDGIVSDKKAGEPTPFYISFLSSEESNIAKRELSNRQSKNESDFPDLASIIPGPSVNSDGTAEAANLLPFPSQQPIRLYDRGLPTEHYGFYTYYDRSIFLKSITRLNGSNLQDGAVPDDEDGGARESEAKFRCTWTQTRFLVQMWTKKGTTSRLLNSTQISTATSAVEQSNFTSAGQDFTQPGSFPYPATITIDRHGGDPSTKMLYCYEMNDRRGLIKNSAQIHDENRGFGGILVNKAPTFFTNASDAGLGGFDGGSGGCNCKWRNFEDVIRA